MLRYSRTIASRRGSEKKRPRSSSSSARGSASVITSQVVEQYDEQEISSRVVEHQDWQEKALDVPDDDDDDASRSAGRAVVHPSPPTSSPPFARPTATPKFQPVSSRTRSPSPASSGPSLGRSGAASPTLAPQLVGEGVHPPSTYTYTLDDHDEGLVDEILVEPDRTARTAEVPASLEAYERLQSPSVMDNASASSSPPTPCIGGGVAMIERSAADRAVRLELSEARTLLARAQGQMRRLTEEAQRASSERDAAQAMMRAHAQEERAAIVRSVHEAHESMGRMLAERFEVAVEDPV